MLTFKGQQMANNAPNPLYIMIYPPATKRKPSLFDVIKFTFKCKVDM